MPLKNNWQETTKNKNSGKSKRSLWKREKTNELKITAIEKEKLFLNDLYKIPLNIISSVKGAIKQLKKNINKIILIDLISK